MLGRRLRRRIERLRQELLLLDRPDYGRYADDPAGYAREVLRVQWWSKQAAIAASLTRPPYRTLVKAAHSVGKSHLAGGLVNWWFDTHNPGVVLTTAPTARQVRDVLWKEVRRQRGGRGGFPGPKIPRLESAPDHFAHGFTATDATSFQGQHEAAVLVIFDEAVGVDRAFWEAAETMVQGQRYAWLAIFNPTDPASQAYAEELSERWTVIDIPATEHPNIAAELAGEPPPYPAAVRQAWLDEHLREWSEPVRATDRLASDVEWPPRSGQWWRPGPLAEARILARWPSAAAGVWSDALWSAVAEHDLPLPPDELPEIGCDVARFGDDNTEIHVRLGPVSLYHEAANGWDTARTAGRLKQLCREWADWATGRRSPAAAPIRPAQIRVKVDDDGVGGGVTDQRGEYSFLPVRAGSTAHRPDDYPNRRSELWFDVADRAKHGRLSFARLPAEVRRRLRLQAMAPSYSLDAAGRRVVEPKDRTKEKLGRSPDGMDAVHLAYCEAKIGVGQFVPPGPPGVSHTSAAAKRGLHGRG